MDVDVELIAKLVAPAVSAVLLAAFKHYTEGKTKLVSYLVHASAITLSGNNTKVHMHTIVVVNSGRKTAHNVRVSHGVVPLPDLAIYPQVQYSVETNPEGFSDILIPALVPKEQVTISYLYFPPMVWSQIMSTVKCDEGLAKVIEVIPMPRPNRLVLTAVWSLMFVGGSFLAYWAIRWLVLWAMSS